jgi:hypothetical protein
MYTPQQSRGRAAAQAHCLAAPAVVGRGAEAALAPPLPSAGSGVGAASQ